MAWLEHISLNMRISQSIAEGRSDNCMISTAQKVAYRLFFPYFIIYVGEMVVKNLIIINALNLGIAVANGVHGALYTEKKEADIETPPPPRPAPAPEPEPPSQTFKIGMAGKVALGSIAVYGLGAAGAYFFGWTYPIINLAPYMRMAPWLF